MIPNALPFLLITAYALSREADGPARSLASVPVVLAGAMVTFIFFVFLNGTLPPTVLCPSLKPAMALGAGNCEKEGLVVRCYRDESFKELLETTEWNEYGVASGNPKCANCMVSCGYETPAILEGFTTLKGFIAMARGNFKKYPNATAMKVFTDAAPHSHSALVQIAEPEAVLEETHA